jgi:hypothetical protein
MGVKGEFCMFYEDSEGNIVPIGSNNLVGVGNSSIIIAGDNCSSPIS